MIDKIINFLKEVNSELKKVNWLTREETIKYTGIVIAASLAVAFFLGGLNYLFTYLLSRFVL